MDRAVEFINSVKVRFEPQASLRDPRVTNTLPALYYRSMPLRTFTSSSLILSSFMSTGT